MPPIASPSISPGLSYFEVSVPPQSKVPSPRVRASWAPAFEVSGCYHSPPGCYQSPPAYYQSPPACYQSLKHASIPLYALHFGLRSCACAPTARALAHSRTLTPTHAAPVLRCSRAHAIGRRFAGSTSRVRLPSAAGGGRRRCKGCGRAPAPPRARRLWARRGQEASTCPATTSISTPSACSR